ncbi:hypothetical protein [Neobacillus fumarioli]|uniref:hypothetical protein n=1 Tax=Neobacillus fumarioli TaxID=105229 RepID=UPI0012EDAEC0|nr:hypothetical protein [Neobacillus fumarioli]
MSFGIVTSGVLLNYFGIEFFRSEFIKLLCLFILSLWAAFIISYFIQGNFKEFHYSNMMNRFGIGTWIAGTSISGILIDKEFIQYRLISEWLFYINIILWMIYIGICVKTFVEMIRTKSFGNIHGILLLSTVSSQSMVLLMNAVFKKVPVIVNLPFLIIGFGFYLVCVLFISYRYLANSWTIERDWNNTNCILHGALSITGIACLESRLVNIFFIQWIWILAFTIFLTIEAIEVYRFFRRIKSFGFKNGIFIYDVTQWSRVFTFGMFYTFTFQLQGHLLFISIIKDAILTAGAWVVIFILAAELVLSLTYILNISKKIPIQKKDMSSSF